MDQSGNSRFSNNSGVISSGLLNKCISGRRGGRLTSILPSHLLTRGGAKKHKFVPNIPVRQEKAKDENSQEKATGEANKDGRHRQDRGNNRGRGRGKPEVLQLQGSVFGEGATDRFVKKDRVSRFSERSSGSGSNAIEIPKYAPMSISTKSDEEDEKESLKKLFKDDFLSDDDDGDGDAFGPVKLPLTTPFSCKKDRNRSVCQSIKIKKEPSDDMCVTIKREPIDDLDEKMDYKCDMRLKEETKVKSEVKHEVESKKGAFSDIFMNKNAQEYGELLFFHFPDCLPENCFADDDVGESTQKTETQDDNSECQKNCKWSLKEMPEGFIGKLQVLKSGKVQLKVGALCFDVEQGSQVGFLQQVAKLDMNEESGNLHVLGHVTNKVVCFPNLENLTNYSYV